MRFVSHITKYRLVAIHEKIEVLASGLPRVLSPGYVVEFRSHDATDREREIARKAFKFKGTVLDEGGLPLDPIDDQHRVSVFDTEWVPEGIREEVEQRLLADPSYGFDYIEVESVKIDPPYQRYVEHRRIQGRRTLAHAISSIKTAYETIGFDIDQAIAYERQEGGPEELVSALNALQEEKEEEELVAA